VSGLLGVYRGDCRIGELWLGDDGRSMGFRYSEAARFAISNSLPLATGVFAPTLGTAHNWFANLLPEEASRQLLVNRLGIADDDFSLLAAIGGDCAGPLRIVDTERADALLESGRSTPISWRAGRRVRSATPYFSRARRHGFRLPAPRTRFP